MLTTKDVCDAGALAGGVSWWKLRRVMRATFAVVSEALARGETVDFSLVKLKVRKHTGKAGAQRRNMWCDDAGVPRYTRGGRKKYVSYRKRNRL
jgi:hypothetical protein